MSQTFTAADAAKMIAERKLTHIKVGVFDSDGVLRGKYMSTAKFLSALKSGYGFCDVVLGWDVNDKLYDNAKFTGWHTGYPDAEVRVLPETCRELPYKDGLLFLSEFAGAAEKVCPRGTLRKVTERARSHGYETLAACEYEFFVFDETPKSIAKKGFRKLKPITPGNFGYSTLRSSVWSPFYHELMAVCESMNIGLEGLHTETGPGVLEAAITYDEVVAAADKAALFKTFAKVVAQKNDLMATFMAKWSPDYPGQSGHIHMSLQKDGVGAFFDPSQPHNMSKVMRHFLAGQQRLMPELLAMVAPTINSYRRLIPGFWAPTDATWGVENRTCALRVIGGSEKSQRVEYRVAAADCNPYLGLAAALGSGLWGIEHELEPLEGIVGNSYAMQHPAELALPTTLWDAAQRLRGSSAARELFGDEFVEHFVASREWEAREFRKHISDWELKRYFEII